LRRKVCRNFWRFRKSSAQCPTVIAPDIENYYSGAIQTDISAFLNEIRSPLSQHFGHSVIVSSCVSEYFVSPRNALPFDKLRANGFAPVSEVAKKSV
jgi:hypothetical protein